MAGNIHELFGFMPRDASSAAASCRAAHLCPFTNGPCTKVLRDGTASGVCTIKPVRSGPVICCPVRLYAGGFQILAEIAGECFGPGLELLPGSEAALAARERPVVAVFGKGWGGELHLPSVGGSGSYFVDWLLAKLAPPGTLEGFAALEVQSIDTTGNYRAERDALLLGRDFTARSTAGLNWENVNKRILPQLIYKGHVLRREPLCTKGLFFVSPKPVFERIVRRLGSALAEYHLQPGSITFRHYDLAPGPVSEGQTLDLIATGSLSTTVDQVALAFTMPASLPPQGVYEQAILKELGR